MTFQDLLPVLIAIGVFLVFLPFRRTLQRLPDRVVYAGHWLGVGITVLLGWLEGSTENLPFLVAFFCLLFVLMVYRRRQDRVALSR
ncbi:hypothetical protein [Rhodothermus marinus]|uniref:Uncharacterized protein n=1 Tax=Rhodothermus marinus (strain ATCC 43812 / DSM 4252 / R-10) TaxID=518766 RepID=D0MHI7_RHOM4|nr:hypothetical protein [Rhodothermus marinus]ACY47945.1 hypothetical protein Rmar_1053 [Rhodothermus marinus DSM 4252]